ncbi:MAG: hypothetical protein GY835_13285 [bacterium]|nr:hypothetical protein [bacterium]
MIFRAALLSAGAAIALSLGWLPHSAGAGPLYLDLDPAEARFTRTVSRQVASILDSLALSLESEAAFDSRFHTARGTLLLDRIASTESVGPYPDLAALLNRIPRPHRSVLGEMLRGDLATMIIKNGDLFAGQNLVAGGSVKPTNTSLIYCDSLRARPVAMRKGQPAIAWDYRDWHPVQPILEQSLILSLNLPAPWQAQLWRRWRIPDSPANACPLFSARFTYSFGPWTREKRIQAWADSIIDNNPGYAEMNFLKKRIFKRSLKEMGLIVRQVTAANMELLRQLSGETGSRSFMRARSLAGAPPVCGLGEHAVLRLVFLPDSRQRHRWLLSAGLITSYKKDVTQRLMQEPGFSAWMDRFGEWQESALSLMRR